MYTQTCSFIYYRVFFVLYSGHTNSLVHGFISDNGEFEGKIHVGNDEYFVESAKQYFKDASQDFHSVIYESRDVHYPHAYGPGCRINEKTKRWMNEVKRYTLSKISQVQCVRFLYFCNLIFVIFFYFVYEFPT